MKPTPYGPFPFSPINRRPPYALPGGARVALWVIINVEFFGLDTPMPGDSNERPKPGDHTPMVRHWAQRDYGNRVGIYRMMDLLQKHGIRATVALNSSMCDHHPEVVEDCTKLGWELMGHCRTNTERNTEVPRDQERAMIAGSLDRIAQFSGRRPVGWLGAGLQETWDTVDHLAAEKCIYVADWVNDDQPYTMTTDKGPLVSVPYTYELNDTAAVVRSKQTPVEFERMICDQFDVLYSEGATSGRVMAIALHPYVTGQPHRMVPLARALAHIDRFPGVWKATGEEIARHHLSAMGG
ncbi:MAG: polysaccharide deacetylase family protein [Proteobacteria bacterium]|jgi:peptidoglycan/xylan/chitin deacetylase (PgdA/CDA1 family)|nr:polysaccharide deacetylase family protein [Pseudomonadota bacterium]